MSCDTEHWSSPNGCHPDCPACAAESDAEARDTFSRVDWQQDVANGDTKLGYEEWLAHQLESHNPSGTPIILTDEERLHRAAPQLLSAYGKLHDMLSDMIEGGRLKESDIPDDYRALVDQLAGPCNEAINAATDKR